MVGMVLLVATLGTPALAAAVAAPTPTPTPTPTSAGTEPAAASSVLEVSPDLSLALEVVEGPVRDEANGTYSTTYELVVTQSASADSEPLSLLGFTTTSDVVSNEGALEQNAELAAQEAPEPTVAPTSTPVPEIRVESGLGIAKRLTTQPKVVGGAFEFTYEITVMNLGDDAVSELRVIDNLAGVFGDDASIEILGVAADGGLNTNDDFDGIVDARLLASGSSLAPQETGRLSVSLAVVPQALGVYEMNAAVAGVSASGVRLIDVSTDGATVDANADGDPSDDSEPTAVSFVNDQTLELELQVLRDASDTEASTSEGTIALTVTNPGPFDVEELQLYEAFADGSETKLLLESATSDTLSMNPQFDGRTDIALLSGQDTLAVGASGVVVLELAASSGELQDLRQIAGAEAVDPFGVTVKAGSDKVLSLAPSAAAQTESDPAGEDGAAGATASASEPDGEPAAVAMATSPAAEEIDGSGDDLIAVSAASLEPDRVSGALRFQYQVGIAGLIALVLALVGGGTAAGINRREQYRSRQVTEWLNTR